MNWLVITIGTALVLVLTAAVVGPFFVDWTAYRVVIEAHAERVLGTPVSIEGEADVRLLPRPRLVLHDVRLGARERPLFEADRVAFDVDLVPLFRREVRIADLTIERPTAYVRIEADGAIAVPDLTEERSFGAYFDARAVEVQSVTAADGTIVLIDRRNVSRTRITDIDVAGSAGSLQGPFTIGGTATVGGVPTGLQIAGGALEGVSMPLSIRAGPAGATLAFDGTLAPSPHAFALSGRVEVTSPDPAISVRGTLTATTQQVGLADAVVTYGRPEASVVLAGRATVPLASAEPIQVALEARQVDLDRLDHALGGAALPEGAIAPQARPPREMLARVGGFLAPLAAFARPAADGPEAFLQLDIGTVLAGGSLVRDISLIARSTLNGLVVDRAEALLPGETGVALSGRLVTGFTGRLDARSSQPAALLGWWTGTATPGTAIDPIIVTADFETSGTAVNARRLELRIGETAATGRARWTGGTDGDAPALDIALAASLVEAEDAARLTDLARAFGTPANLGDVALDLAVDRLRLGPVEGDSLTLKGDYSDDVLTVDAFVADDVAGAQVFASGSIAGLTAVPVGRIEGTLTVADGARLATAAEALLSGEAAARLAAALPALAPADLRFALTGRPAERVPDLALEVSGAMGAAELSLSATGSPLSADALTRPVTVEASASSNAPASLLATLGLGALGESGTARVALGLDGVPADGLDTTAEATLGALSARYDGRIALGERLTFGGEAALAAPLVAPLAALAGVTLPEIGPVDLAARVARFDGPVTIDAIDGTVAGGDVAGRLVASPEGLTGQLDLADLALEPLLAMILGAGALTPGPDSAPWPVTAFAAPAAVPVPVDVTVRAERLSLADTALSDARFGLSLDTGRLALRDFTAGLGESRLAGSASLDRNGPQASLSADVALDAAPLASVVWAADGEPVATGTFRLQARLASSAVTLAGLASGLTGSGEIALTDGVLGLDLAAVTVPDLADAASPAEAEVRAAVLEHLAGRTSLPRLAVPVDVAAGTLRVQDVPIGSATARASIDIGTLALTSDWTIPVEPAWTDGRSTVTVRFAGPLAAPERTVDVSELTAWLSLRQLERQVDLVEQQNRELAAEAERDGVPAPTVAPFDMDGDAAEDDAAPAPAPRTSNGTANSPAEGAADADAPAVTPGYGAEVSPGGASDASDGSEIRRGDSGTSLPLPSPGASQEEALRRQAAVRAGGDPIADLLSTFGAEDAPVPAEAGR